ncbi:MAG: GtrA family protein [Chloroflexi bacterium]|nr:GtrA family protein [Chloroflexota bacterium]MBP8055756.1 GtrA family protein [Chloroflexota bacterium]
MITFFAAQAEMRLGANAKEVERFLKFAVVGTIGFIIDFGLLTLFKEVFGLHTAVANTLSFCAAVVSNFTLNRYWTYPDSRSKKLSSQLTQFLLVSIIGLLINDAIVILMEHPFQALLDTSLNFLPLSGYIPAKVVATIVVLFWNYFVNRRWTYNDVK